MNLVDKVGISLNFVGLAIMGIRSNSFPFNWGTIWQFFMGSIDMLKEIFELCQLG